MASTNVTSDFFGFENEGRTAMRRLVDVEREMRFMNEVLEGIMVKYKAKKKKIRK